MVRGAEVVCCFAAALVAALTFKSWILSFHRESRSFAASGATSDRCLHHESPRVRTVDAQHNCSAGGPPSSQLRFDWANLTLVSPMARRIAASQRPERGPCYEAGGASGQERKVAWSVMNNYGLGSDLHTWSQALCNALHLGMALSVRGSWIWEDSEFCGIGARAESGDAGREIEAAFATAGPRQPGGSCYFEGAAGIPPSTDRCPSTSFVGWDNGRARGSSCQNALGRYRDTANSLR